MLLPRFKQDHSCGNMLKCVRPFKLNGNRPLVTKWVNTGLYISGIPYRATFTTRLTLYILGSLDTGHETYTAAPVTWKWHNCIPEMHNWNVCSHLQLSVQLHPNGLMASKTCSLWASEVYKNPNSVTNSLWAWLNSPTQGNNRLGILLRASLNILEGILYWINCLDCNKQAKSGPAWSNFPCIHHYLL